jgi:dCMP deaminase
MIRKRPDWDTYFLGVAKAVSARADCTRRLVGAILVNPFTHDILYTGYNGAPRGEPGCLTANACPRGQHYQVFPESITSPCACGNNWPCHLAVASGSDYDVGPGLCIAIHAEENVLLCAGRNAIGKIMYATHRPCNMCMRLIRGAGVDRVIWPSGEEVFDL